MPCTHREKAKTAAKGCMLLLAWVAILVPFVEDCFADTSAGVVGEDGRVQSWGVFSAYVLLAVTVNGTSLIYDSSRLKMGGQDDEAFKASCLGKCQANSCISGPTLRAFVQVFRVLFATGVFGYYAYITTVGMLVDYEPYQLQGNSTDFLKNATEDPTGPQSARLLLHQLLDVLPDEKAQCALNLTLAILSTLLFVLVEGVAGWLFYSGEEAVKKTLLVCLRQNRPDDSDFDEDTQQLLQDDADEKLKCGINRFNQMRFVVGLISTIFFSLTVFISLFDAYCIDGEVEGSLTLWVKRSASLVLAVFYAMANVDYYLAELQRDWIRPGVKSWWYRVPAALGMGAYYFALDMNRWVQLMELYSRETAEQGSPLYYGGLAYAIMAGGAVGALRYLLACCHPPQVSSGRSTALSIRPSVVGASFLQGSPPSGRYQHKRSSVVPKNLQERFLANQRRGRAESLDLPGSYGGDTALV